MNDEEYTQKALRTEQILPATDEIPVELLEDCFKAIAALGTVIDGVKRVVFYKQTKENAKTPADLDKIAKRDHQIKHAIMNLNDITCNLHDMFVCDENTVEDVGTRQTAISLRLAHAVIGKCTELGELADTFADALVNDELTKEQTINILEEEGDGFWYDAILCSDLCVPMSEVKEANIRKLQARFPDWYSQEAVLNRDIDAEMKALDLERSGGEQ